MRIRCVAHAVIRHRDELLVTCGGKRSDEALRREVRDELGVELSRADRLGVLENIFDFEGRQHHEIAFAFDCDVADASFYDRERYHIFDTEEVATWAPLADFASGAKRLVLDGLLALIRST